MIDNYNKTNKKIETISNLFNMESKITQKYIKEKKLKIQKLLTEIEKSSFTKDNIKELTDIISFNSVNPLFILLIELKDSVKNMTKIINFFNSYNLKKEILTFYLGVANLTNDNKDLLTPLKKMLTNFDSKLNLYIDESASGKNQNIANFQKKIINILKFSSNSDFEPEYECNINYNKMIINLAYMRVFLELANASVDEYEGLKYYELTIDEEDQFKKNQLFFFDLELYEEVILEKIINLIFEDVELETDNIIELLNYFVYVKDLENVSDYDEEVNPKLSNKATSTPSRPETNLKKPFKINYANLEKMLKEKIIGQDVIVSDVIKRIKIADFGISKQAGAKAVFLFVGPTGVGKTELVKLISNNISDNKSNLLRIDMSEYKEEHTVSKLIGAPPGYVGYDEKNETTVFEKIITNPNAVILLDEIEKAHPEVLDVFLHVFDEGKAMTNKQQEVDFSNNLIFMTSNIGTYETTKNKVGFHNNENIIEKRKVYLKALETNARPEFINRIDEIIVFKDLKKEEIMIIFYNYLDNIKKELETKKQINLDINLSARAAEYLINKMEYKKYGAREVRRITEKYIIEKIISVITEKNVNQGQLYFDYIENQLVCNYEKVKLLERKKTN